MIFVLSYHLVTRVYGLFAQYAPSNIIIRYLRSPRGLKWALPVGLLLATTYYFVAGFCGYLAEAGNAWLYIPFLMSFLSMVKFAATVLFSPFWLLGSWLGSRRDLAARQGALPLDSVKLGTHQSVHHTRHATKRHDTRSASAR